MRSADLEAERPSDVESESDAADPRTAEADDAVDARAGDHLSDLADGSGCTEIWEHLSERREREADAPVEAEE